MKNEIFLKGIYSHPQISGFICARQYMIIVKDEKKYLTVRFSNDSDFTLTAVSIDILQLDSRGRILQKNTVSQQDMHLLPGSMFAPMSVVEADPKCSDVKVYVNYADSGEYRYTQRKGRITSNHLPHKEQREYGDEIYVRQQDNPAKKKLFPIIAALLLVGMICINLFQIMFPFIKAIMKPGEDGESTAADNSAYVYTYINDAR